MEKYKKKQHISRKRDNFILTVTKKVEIMFQINNVWKLFPCQI